MIQMQSVSQAPAGCRQDHRKDARRDRGGRKEEQGEQGEEED
jgi:hypothetical protein